MECVDVATFICREITTVLKIAVDNVILELCDWCDYFASPLNTRVKNQLNLIVTLKNESCKLLIVLLLYRLYPYISRRKLQIN